MEIELILVAMKMISERRIANIDLFECLMIDIEICMNRHEINLKNFLQIFDCYYKLLFSNENHINNIGSYLLKMELTPESFDKFKTNEILRFFRGLF